MEENQHIVIIGAGISGLASGIYLKKRNIPFIILEKEKTAGGVLKTNKINNFICELSANTIQLDENLNEICNYLDLNDKIIYSNKKFSKNRFIYFNKKLQKIFPSPLFIFSTKLLSFRGKIRFFKELFIKSLSYEEETIKQFIERRFGNEFHKNILEPALTGIYAGDTSKLLIKYSLPILVENELKYGSIIKSFLFAKKKIKPQKIITFKNGIQDLIEKATEKLNENIFFENEVISINKINEKFEIIFIKNNIKNKIFSKKIILTTPSYITENLLITISKNLSKYLSKIEYNSISVLNISFLKKDIRNIKKGYGFLCKKNETKYLLGAIFKSLLFTNNNQEEFILFTLFIKRNSTENENFILKNAVNELKDILKITGDNLFSHHKYWEKAIPQYNIGYEKIIKEIKKFENENYNLFLLANYIGGVSVNSCIKNAKNLIDKI